MQICDSKVETPDATINLELNLTIYIIQLL
jgi:hypothetical protein